jgi:hypothetical protein
MNKVMVILRIITLKLLEIMNSLVKMMSVISSTISLTPQVKCLKSLGKIQIV